jgi:hypothetical protein
MAINMGPVVFRKTVITGPQLCPELDSLLSESNESYTGEDIRRKLARAGYFICKMPGGVHAGACPTCGCEIVGAKEEFHARPLAP